MASLKDLSTQAKVAIVAGVAAVAAIGVGVAVWQPWNQTAEPPQEPAADQQEPVTPPAPAAKGLSVRANGEEVPCTLYEGEGWSVYVPEGWEARPAGSGAVFTSSDGAEMTVDFQDANGGKDFIALSAPEEIVRQLQFVNGNTLLAGSASKSRWTAQYEKLFAALAKTLTVGTDTPFAESYIIPQEPDWQEADGMTVLFQDKDGVVLDDMVEKAVEDYMLSWSQEDREIYTGQYRINGIDWTASYTGLSSSYIDVFRARVQYRVAADKLEEAAAREGVTVVDGWASLTERVHLVFGDDVTKPQTVIAPETEDWTGFVELIA
ncbi:MAG: hypothetical protein K2N78_04420 [Oscillospiraceae bacterium]|nr:hypothetical protein [Oscillospiraceae bacterium]